MTDDVQINVQERPCEDGDLIRDYVGDGREYRGHNGTCDNCGLEFHESDDGDLSSAHWMHTIESDRRHWEATTPEDVKRLALVMDPDEEGLTNRAPHTATRHAQRIIAAAALPVLAADKDAEAQAGVELDCERCHGPNVVWFADSPLWNEVVGGAANTPADGMLCIGCFAMLCEDRLDEPILHVSLGHTDKEGDLADSLKASLLAPTARRAETYKAQRDEAREQLADRDKTIAAVSRVVKGNHPMPYCQRDGDIAVGLLKRLNAALADPGQWEAERYIVHVAEIRLHETDPWDVCEVGVYPIVGGLAAAIASLSDRLDVELDRQQETDRNRWVTRTLDGKLREVRVETIHRGGESYFRHRIMRADNHWLTPRADRVADGGEK